MFYCELCKRHSKPGDKAVWVVIERRPKEYRDRTGKRSVGWESVKEVKACAECVAKQGQKV